MGCEMSTLKIEKYQFSICVVLIFRNRQGIIPYRVRRSVNTMTEKVSTFAVKVLSAVFALTALLSGCAGESGTPAMGCGKI